MKIKIAATAVALCSCLAIQDTWAAVVSVGSGPQSSIVSLTAGGVVLEEYEVFYDLNESLTLDPQGNAAFFDTAFLLFLVDATDPNLELSLINGGTVTEPNYFLGSMSYGGISYPGYDGQSGLGQWAAGGSAGFPSATPISSDNWTYGSGISAPYREIADGSHEVIAFDPYADPAGGDFSQPEPSFAPVPEPSGLMYLGVGLGLAFCRRRP